MSLNIVNSLKRSFYKTELKVKQHSPEILLGVGIVGGIASGIIACRATLKIDEVLEEPNEYREKIEKHVEENGYTDDYTEKDRNKDLCIVYGKTALALFKLYAPSITLGALSIASLLGAYNVLNKRNAGLVAAYATIDRSFRDYRDRVIDRFGEELDRELRFDIKPDEVEETVVNEKGKEKTVKKKVQTVEKTSDYSKFFMQGCKGWTKDPNQNYMILRDLEDYATNLLKLKGYLFLNDVYDLLGIPRTQAGQIVGWIYDEKNPIGDNRVDFNLHNGSTMADCRFINGLEPVILLDFNVDGPIINEFWKMGLDNNVSGNISRDVFNFPNGIK